MCSHVETFRSLHIKVILKYLLLTHLQLFPFFPMIVDALIHEKQTVILFNDFCDVQQSFVWKEAINLEEKKILKQVKKSMGQPGKIWF